MTIPGLATAFILAALAAERPDLTGRVNDQAGAPLAGAHVFISTAAPRKGTSTLCPSCYADCAKRATSAVDGTFRIASLDPELLFDVLVIAEGHAPRIVRKVDPAAAGFEAALTRFDPARLAADRVVRGRVIGPEGSAVAGAVVEPSDFETDAFRGFSPRIFDPLAVTDLEGRFLLTSSSPVRRLRVRVEGRGLAPQLFPDLKPAETRTLTLAWGAEVRGRLVSKDGSPVEGAVIGMVQANRSMGRFLGHKEVATDDAGRFLFSNVAPEDIYFLYGVMKSLGERGALVAREVKVEADGSRKDLGDLTLERGYKLAGRVILSDRAPVPQGTRLLVARADAWDSLNVTLDGSGRFSMVGLPVEEVSVHVRIPGYRLSARNKTIDPDRGESLTGFVEQDTENLTILLEPSTAKPREPSRKPDGL